MPLGSGASSLAWVLPAGLPRRWAVDRRQADGEGDERGPRRRDEQPASRTCPAACRSRGNCRSGARRASRTTTVALIVRGCRNGDGCRKSIIPGVSVERHSLPLSAVRVLALRRRYR